MMSVAKLNYDVNPEIGKMYFEKLVKYKPEALIYLSDYYYEKKR
jgi:tetratricopeptide domain protein